MAILIGESCRVSDAEVLCVCQFRNHDNPKLRCAASGVMNNLRCKFFLHSSCFYLHQLLCLLHVLHQIPHVSEGIAPASLHNSINDCSLCLFQTGGNSRQPRGWTMSVEEALFSKQCRKPGFSLPLHPSCHQKGYKSADFLSFEELQVFGEAVCRSKGI